jgi:hypothetical protein
MKYHLRELADHGFVEEVPERARGRERWWRAVKADLRFAPTGQQSPEMQSVFDELNRLAVATDLELFARFQLQPDDMGAWADTLRYSRGAIMLPGEPHGWPPGVTRRTPRPRRLNPRRHRSQLRVTGGGNHESVQ